VFCTVYLVPCPLVIRCGSTGPLFCRNAGVSPAPRSPLWVDESKNCTQSCALKTKPRNGQPAAGETPPFRQKSGLVDPERITKVQRAKHQSTKYKAHHCYGLQTTDY